MSLYLSYEEKGVVQRFTLNKSRVTLGRKNNNHCVLNHPTISAHHAVIWVDPDNHRLSIDDLASTNGTYVNDQVVIGRQGLALGDIIRLGSLPLLFDEATATPQDLSHIKRAAPDLDLKQGERLGQLLIHSGPQKGQIISLSKPSTRFGKAGNCMAVIQRAQLAAAHSSTAAADNSAVEPTYYAHQATGKTALVINGEPCAKPTLLQDGDVLELLDWQLQFFVSEPRRIAA